MRLLWRFPGVYCGRVQIFPEQGPEFLQGVSMMGKCAIRVSSWIQAGMVAEIMLPKYPVIKGL